VAFPEEPLGLRIALKTGGAWTDITPDVKTAEPITHARGIRNSGTSADPASCTLKINNLDGKYSPRNPMSPLWGLVGRNTPVRLWLPGGPHFLDLDGDPANYASTPDAAALDITADLDIRAEADINWYDPTANQVLIAKWDGAANQRSYSLRVYSQQLALNWSPDGITNLTAIRNLPTLPPRAAVRATLDVNDGTGRYVARLYWAESLAGPWTQIGGDLTGTATSVFAGTAPLRVGGHDPTTTPPRTPFTGKGYRFEVRNGINGTIVAAPDFEVQALDTTSFVDSASLTWTLAGQAAVTDRQDLFVGEIPEWPQDWAPSGESAWTSVTAAGILRRLGQGTKPLDSTLRRRIPSGTPVAYWPMEEERDATRAYSPIKGVQPAALTGVEWAAVDTLPSSKSLPRLTAAATLSAIVPTAADGQWQTEFVYNADDKAAPAGGQYAEVISVSTTGTVRRWVIGMRSGSARIWGYDASGTDIIFRSVAVGGDVFHGWVRMRLYARDIGDGTLTWWLGFQDVGGDAGGTGGTFTGSAGHVTAVTANWGPLTEGWGFGHLSVVPTAPSNLYDGSDNAYSGETAWARMSRLAGEESVPMARIAGPLEPARVGPQRPETLVSLLQAAADADGGRLLEAKGRLGLVYRDRSSLYTQEPALVLDYAAGEVVPPLKPVDDDADVRNDRTVTRDGGSSARAVLEEGPLSVQDPPDGIGLYDDAVTLSLADDTQTEPIAYWLLHLGTWDEARYPSVRIRLHKAPHLIPAVLALREGDVIRLKNLPVQAAFGDVDLIVEGYTETLLPRTWERTLTCSPGGPWNVAKADHLVYGKTDTDGSELAAAVTDTDTALDVRTTAGLPWTTDPAEAPWDIEAGGEVMTVTAVGSLLNTNPWFDPNITGWSAQNSTIAHSTAVVHPKARGSLRITPNGSSATGTALCTLTPVGSIQPGAQYTVSLWAYSPGGWTGLQPAVNWHNSAGSYVSTSSSSGFTVPAGKWTHLKQTVTAPATASRAALIALHSNTPSASDIWYVWAARLIGPHDSFTDSLNRSVSGGWGTADSGQVWTPSGGAVSTDYSVNGAAGLHVHTTRNIFRSTVAPSPSADVDVVAEWTMDKMPVGDLHYVYLGSRYTDANHVYFARINITTAGVMQLTIRKRNATETLLTSVLTVSGTFTPGTWYRLRFETVGTTLRAKAWPASGTEPSAWQLSVEDSDLTAPGSVMWRSYIGGNSTQTLPIAVSVNSYEARGLQRLTVDRSRNGVTKAHPAGTPVRLAHPAIASL
jgi:hypothetical protein